MKGYKHLTEFDRNKIARMRKEGATMREIGAALHVSAATVCREIKRGTYTYMNADYIEVTEYIPERSQARYRANMAAKGGPLKIGSDRRYAETLEALIADDNYSPEAALHEIENNPEKYGSFETRICRQTLYAYIDKGVFLRLTNKALPFKGSRRKKKTKHVQRAKQQPKGESIEKRPPEIDGRQEFGHWEMDLVVSCRGGHKCLLVLTERVTRMEVIRLIRDKSAASVVRALDTMERKWGTRFPQVFQSITMDNGSEFADYIGIERSVYKRCESKRTRTYYCHRNKIARMRKEGATMREIGAALHVSAATVCREIKRGTYTYMNADYIEVTEYIPERSQARYRANMAAKGGPLKIGSDRRYAETLEALIADDNYSPEAALHEIENNPEKYGSFETRICRQTLYAYIDKGVFLRLTNKALPFKGSRRKKKTKHVQRAKQQPKGESIEKRPPEIDGRQEFGHWEMDLVVSCRGGHKCLLVLTERVTRMEVIRLIRDKSAASVVRALDTMERKWGTRFPQVFQSITMDNGSEFADYIGIERSVYKRCESKRTRTYYCHPYCSSERGSNEKQNQMIRRKFPKGTNFDKVTQKDVEAVESWLNRYPRQLLGWASAGQLFEGYLQTV